MIMCFGKTFVRWMNNARLSAISKYGSQKYCRKNIDIHKVTITYARVCGIILNS